MDLDQQRRYARQIMLADMGEAGQQALLAARVLVIGAGGLGSALISYLAAAGVGTLGILDPDRVERSNLARQILHETGDIGRLKVESARDRVAELNPETNIITYPLSLTIENAEAIIDGTYSATAKPSPLAGDGWVMGLDGEMLPFNAPSPSLSRKGRGTTEFAAASLATHHSPLTTHYDIVADGCDNFATRFAVNRACVTLQKPLVSAAIAGWHGNVMSILPASTAQAGCYQCFVNPEAPEANTCRDSGIIGPLAGIIGSMQALEVVNILLGRPALARHIAFYDAKRMTQRLSERTRDAACPVCGPAARNFLRN